MFTQPSAPFLPVATNSAYDTSFFAPAGGGGGGLPAGANGDYLFNDGIDWVAQSDPILMGPGVNGGSSGSGNIAIGTNANTASAGSNNVAIGTNAIVDTSAVGSVAIGYNSLVSPNANQQGIAIGINAEVQNQGGVVIGPNAHSGDGITCTSIGINAGNSNNSKTGNVSLGWYAGNANLAGPSANQGAYAVNIGCFAGYAGNGSADNSITINAQGQSGPTINSLSAEHSSLYVAPILASTMTNYLSYDPVSKLVGYGAPSGGGSPTFTFVSGSNSGSLNSSTSGGSVYFSYQIISGFTSGTTYQFSAIMPFRVIQSTSEQLVALTANSYCQAFLANGSLLGGGTAVIVSPPFPCGALPATFADTIVSGLSGTFTATATTILYMVFYSATPVSNPTNVNNNWTFTGYALT